MKLTPAQVRHVADLARLQLKPEDEARFTTQLSAVLEAVDLLAQVDTTGVAPTSWVVNVAPHTREDVARGMLSTEEVLENAPKSVGTSFAIPRVIE
jgi:aspartyl-tRNA(Asn)/glutamyl-tRNA(Gln) amidotransferase subunit C